MGGISVFNFEDRINDRLQPSGIKQGPESVCERPCNFYFLGQRSTAQAGADDPQAFSQHGTQVNFSGAVSQTSGMAAP